MSSEPEIGYLLLLFGLASLLRVALVANGGSLRILLLFLHLLVATLAPVVIGFFQAHHLVLGLEFVADAALLDFLPFLPDILAVLDTRDGRWCMGLLCAWRGRRLQVPFSDVLKTSLLSILMSLSGTFVAA